MAKDKDYMELINTSAWLHLRRDKLSRNPLCEDCQAKGNIRPATEVHHVVPVENGLTREEKRRLMFDPHNLRSLCHPCHVKAHEAMGRSGKAATKRLTAAHLRRFKEKFM